MIPHITIPEGDKISGVIGIIKNEIKDEYHDSKPIKFVIMFATPVGHQKQHLEILATISKYFMNTFLETIHVKGRPAQIRHTYI